MVITISNKGDCPIHKKPIMYSYNDEDYCKDCLDDRFEVIEELKDFYKENPK